MLLMADTMTETSMTKDIFFTIVFQKISSFYMFHVNKTKIHLIFLFQTNFNFFWPLIGCYPLGNVLILGR